MSLQGNELKPQGAAYMRMRTRVRTATLTAPGAGERAEQLDLSDSAVDCSHCGKHLAGSDSEWWLTCHLSQPLHSCTFTQDPNLCSHKNLYATVYPGLIHNHSKLWTIQASGQPVVPLRCDERNESLVGGTAGENPRCIMLTKVARPPKLRTVWFHLYDCGIES